MAVEIAVQRIDKQTLRCFSQEDADAIGEYPPHKILRARITGAQKPRSYEQLKLYWACCRSVAENTDDPQWNAKDKVDFQCKIKCRLIKEIVVVDGNAHIIPGSISYVDMKHLEACNYFDRAFDEMATFLGITREELLDNADN